MKLKRLHITIIITLFCLLSRAQSNTQDSLPTVKILARVQDDKILLRWAVNDAITWQKTNTSGFILEKYLFSKNGERLPQPERIWSKPIKADPLETWQDIVENNDYAAIIAQAIYGESFLIEGGSEGELADIVNLVNENEQRFSFALLAADMNFDAAKKAGWGYTDTQVNKNEEYAYRIQSALPQEQLAVKASTVLAGLNDYEPLPPPIDLQAIFRDKSALITWEYELFKSIYTSYSLERSEDGTNFTPLSKEPLVNLNDKPEAPAKRMYYIDSLAQNNKTYYYRVNGISPFGEKGTYSEVVSGQGQAALLFTPRISDFKFTENQNEAVIIWEFPKEGEAVIEKFQLNQANKDSGPYSVVVDNIPVTQREITYSKLNPSNYFTITAIGKAPKQQKTSFSTLIQPIDSIPPASPVELEGNIDTLGIVRFKWKPNTEQDMLGYRIFRGFTATEEPSQITVSPIEVTQFTDTVVVENLNSKVYYQVVAVDKRFNHSRKSEVLVLEKPDVIPPTAPVFSNYKIENGTVKIFWINSSEENATHILTRKNITDSTQWETVYTVNDTIEQFTDTKVDVDKVYQYHIKAVDKSGLESLPSPPLTVRVTDLTPQDIIKELNYTVYREDNYIDLFWRANNEAIAEYTIYKQINDKDPTIMRVVPANIKRLIDRAINPNQEYTYYIKATLTNGKFSKVKIVKIKY